MSRLSNSILILFILCSSLAVAQNEMVKVPSGEYTPLYREDSTVTKTHVEAFYMDQYAVTNEEYKAFVKDHKEWQKDNVKELFADQQYLRNWSDNLSFDEKIKNSPVTNVSWFSAKAYCQYQGKRLPTINEWEYAAAASENKANALNDKDFYQRMLDWYSRPNPAYYPAVTNGFKNYYGIYGMHGMIWEWVSDFNSVLLIGESRANAGIDRNLFCAGGTIGANDTKNYVAFLRYAFRSSLKANYTTRNLGFRCAKDVELNQ